MRSQNSIASVVWLNYGSATIDTDSSDDDDNGPIADSSLPITDIHRGPPGSVVDETPDSVGSGSSTPPLPETSILEDTDSDGDTIPFCGTTDEESVREGLAFHGDSRQSSRTKRPATYLNDFVAK